jgi:hypothetical protein
MREGKDRSTLQVRGHAAGAPATDRLTSNRVVRGYGRVNDHNPPWPGGNMS